MGAAQPAHDADAIGVTAVRRPSESPASPVYARRPSDDDPGRFVGSAADRNAANQLLQWLIIFAVVSVPIIGAKWWNARQDAAIAELASAPPISGDVIASASLAAGSDADQTASTALRSERLAAVGAATPGQANGSGAAGATDQRSGANRTSPIAAQPAPPAADVPVVRAPAQVPYPTRTLDVAPVIPDSASVGRGIAVLSLLIDTLGNVVEVELLRSVDPALDAAAVAAARRWKFEPTMRDGKPVAVRSNFTVPFGY